MRTRACLLSVAFLFLPACGAEDAPDMVADPVGVQREALEPTAAYLIGRQDLRRCRWPLCGGYFIRALNRTSLRCLDGSLARECYVAALDAEALGGAALGEFGAGQAVVHGAQVSGDAGEFGPYALLRVDAAWAAASEAAPDGSFASIEDNGLRCVQAPCFSFTVRELNRTRSSTVSELDLTAVGASEAELERAYLAVSEEGLIAAGRRVAERATGAARFEATQFYLPVSPATGPEPCQSDSDCALSFYTAPVQSSADCYCPTCPVPLALLEAQAYAAGFEAFCAGTHGIDVCPPPPCAAPPPVVCAAGTCAYGSPEFSAPE